MEFGSAFAYKETFKAVYEERSLEGRANMICSYADPIKLGSFKEHSLTVWKILIDNGHQWLVFLVTIHRIITVKGML